MAKINSFVTELVGEAVSLVGGDVGSEVDALWLFKIEGKDLGKQSSAEDDLADELQRVQPLPPGCYWDNWDGNEVDGDQPLFEVGLPTPLSSAHHLDFGMRSSWLFFR